MKKWKKAICAVLPVMLLAALFCTPALALTKAEVQNKVNAVGKGAVTGNILIWFLCAVAFLKIAQKMDSILSSLGLNVGHTGGSMLGEAMMAVRTITMLATKGSRGGSGSGSGGGNSGWFMRGGLAGMVSRQVTNDAVRTATTRTDAVPASPAVGRTEEAPSDAASVPDGAGVSGPPPVQQPDVPLQSSQPPVGEGVAVPTDGIIVEGDNEDDGYTIPAPVPAAEGESDIPEAPAIEVPVSEEPSPEVSSPETPEPAPPPIENTRAAAPTEQRSGARPASRDRPSLGGMIFSRSLASGGRFANDVIGTVARGEVRGSITGDLAAQSLTSYMGISSDHKGTAQDAPGYSDVEIGHGQITGMETAPGSTEAVRFAMYQAERYERPTGSCEKVTTADGTQWYRQYAKDTVERTPYKAPDDSIAYHESIVKRLPDPPRRKERT